MDHSCDRGLSSGADIGSRARDGAGGRQASKHGRDDVGHALANQFDVGIVAVVAHAIGDHRRHQGFNRAQHGDGDRRAQQSVNKIGAEAGNRQMRQAAGNAAETASNGVDGKLEEIYCRGSEQQHQNWSGNAIGGQAANHKDGDRCQGQSRRGVIQRAEVAGQRFHAEPEDAGDLVQVQTEEISHLGAGDQNGDAVGESDDDGPGNELHRRTHAGRAHDHQQNTGHHGAHEQSVNTVLGDDGRDHYHKGPGRAADLGPGASQQRNEEAGHDGAVNAGLRREAGGDGKRHGQRQRDQPNRDARDGVVRELGKGVVPKTKYGLRKPALYRESSSHSIIMSKQRRWH